MDHLYRETLFNLIRSNLSMCRDCLMRARDGLDIEPLPDGEQKYSKDQLIKALRYLLRSYAMVNTRMIDAANAQGIESVIDTLSGAIEKAASQYQAERQKATQKPPENAKPVA